MGRNLVLPYAIIAVLGIFIMIAISFVGANQRDAIENPEEASEENVVLEPEDIYARNSCANCHGGNLDDGNAPPLNDVNSRLSQDEIQEIILNGRPDKGMPGNLVNAEQAAALAEWLSEME